MKSVPHTVQANLVPVELVSALLQRVRRVLLHLLELLVVEWHGLVEADAYAEHLAAEELLGIIEGLNGTSEVRENNPAGCCWDFGHGRMFFDDESAKELEKVVPHLLCTHVHDNRARDDHQPPFTGKMDWPPLMKVLRDGGYRGNLSLELHYGRFPERVLPAYLNFCRAAGEELIRMVTDGEK